MADASLNLVVIRCAELDASARFYEAIGLSFVRHRHGNGPEHLASETPAMIFELYPLGDHPPTVSTRIRFKVDDIDTTLTTILAHGATLVTPARDSPWGRRAVVADPDGHRVELVEEGT